MSITSKEELEAPEHWEWSQEWEVLDAGVENKDGWQYAVDKEGKSWSSNMRNTHLVRKRTLVRRMAKQRDQKVDIAWSCVFHAAGVVHLIMFIMQSLDASYSMPC